MTIKKNLVVANGEYEINGQRKTRWLTIGHVHEGQKGAYITLERSINLAGLMHKPDDTRIFVNLFDPRERGGSGRDSNHNPEPVREEDVPW